MLEDRQTVMHQTAGMSFGRSVLSGLMLGCVHSPVSRFRQYGRPEPLRRV